jgi:hypothetical protein
VEDDLVKTIPMRKRVVFFVAWSILALGVIVVGYQQDANSDRDAADGLAAADALCEQVAQVNQQMRDLLTVIGAPRVPPAGSTPAQLEGYETANAERAKLRQFGDTLFPAALCADGIPPKSAIPPTTGAPPP